MRRKRQLHQRLARLETASIEPARTLVLDDTADPSITRFCELAFAEGPLPAAPPSDDPVVIQMWPYAEAFRTYRDGVEAEERARPGFLERIFGR